MSSSSSSFPLVPLPDSWHDVSLSDLAYLMLASPRSVGGDHQVDSEQQWQQQGHVSLRVEDVFARSPPPPPPMSDLLEGLKCSICTDLFVAPRSIGSCGHTFCGPCISAWVKTQLAGRLLLTCPECRAHFRSLPFVPSRALEATVLAVARSSLPPEELRTFEERVEAAKAEDDATRRHEVERRRAEHQRRLEQQREQTRLAQQREQRRLDQLRRLDQQREQQRAQRQRERQQARRLRGAAAAAPQQQQQQQRLRAPTPTEIRIAEVADATPAGDAAKLFHVSADDLLTSSVGCRHCRIALPARSLRVARNEDVARLLQHYRGGHQGRGPRDRPPAKAEAWHLACFHRQQGNRWGPNEFAGISQLPDDAARDLFLRSFPSDQGPPPPRT